ncbi:Ig-like domain-containing protein, partial [Aeromicrobium sp.]|uniref:Ig-like domain-containing protein n=1 Tax=Aeromicrobium sp. TaxID=1871063 RepID=UPI00199F1A31
LSIAKASTTTRATAPQSERFGKDIMVKTAVSSSTGTTPTGDVTLTEGPASLDARALADGTVTLTAEALSIGKHRLTATFAGDANHTGSTTTVEVTILRGVQPITATVKSSTYGTSAVMHVTGPAGAAGTVYVGNGNDVVGAGTMAGGAASFLLDKTLLPGTYVLDVYYGGDASFEPATTSVDLTVDRATTALTKGTSTSRIVVNATRAKVRFTVTAPGFTVAGGTVRVYSGTTLVGKGTVVRGRATARMSRFTSTGTKTLVAKYSGNEVAKESTRSFTLKVVRR